jgi:hypothetical protein
MSTCVGAAAVAGPGHAGVSRSREEGIVDSVEARIGGAITLAGAAQGPLPRRHG